MPSYADIAREKFKARVWNGIAARIPGYDSRNWLRIRQIEAFEKFLSQHEDAAVFEVSPGWNRYWKERIKNYSSAEFPEFDICKQALDQTFDIVIADQVLEHVADPLSAACNIRAMVKQGGHALVATPFLFRVHARPHDYHRWTEAGMKQLLSRAGFATIATSSWGNKACAKAHIGGPIRDYGLWRSLENDPEYPLQVWAIAS